MISAEEQYYIDAVEVNVCRDGKSIVDDRHLITSEDFLYYKVQRKEIRYVIKGSYGISYLPHRVYEGALQNECYFASSICSITRKYKRELDKTYFRYFDDAEEVLINITKFIRWLRTVPNLNLKKAQIKNIMAENSHWLREVPDPLPGSQDQQLIQALRNSSSIKRRSDLKGIALFNQNEEDLVD